MSDLLSQLWQLPLLRDHNQAAITREQRSYMLVKIGQQLLDLGYTTLTVTTLEEEHIIALMALWESQRLGEGTRRNRLCVLRWWAKLIGKESIVIQSNKPYGLAREYDKTYEKERRRHAKERHPVMPTPPPRPLTLDQITDPELVKLLPSIPVPHQIRKTVRTRRRKFGSRKKDIAFLSEYPETCVYIIQLTEDTDVLKIGQTMKFSGRIKELRSQNGHFDIVMLIPYQNPQKLERMLHHHFSAMRIYQGASPTELFKFDTRKKQKFFDNFLAQFSRFLIHQPHWQSSQKNHIATSNSLQGCLFPLQGEE